MHLSQNAFTHCITLILQVHVANYHLVHPVLSVNGSKNAFISLHTTLKIEIEMYFIGTVLCTVCLLLLYMCVERLYKRKRNGKHNRVCYLSCMLV